MSVSGERDGDGGVRGRFADGDGERVAVPGRGRFSAAGGQRGGERARRREQA
jgi:hypothetical protein